MNANINVHGYKEKVKGKCFRLYLATKPRRITVWVSWTAGSNWRRQEQTAGQVLGVMMPDYLSSL